MKVSIIAAIGPKRELGKDNKLLWHISEDLKRFKKLTEGHAVIMGRKTFESLGQPLPNRLNIIITRQRDFLETEKVRYRVSRLIGTPLPNSSGSLKSSKQVSSPSLIVSSSLEEAINNLKSNIYHLTSKNEVFIIGGGQIYEQALPLADKLYLTIVEKIPEHPDGKFAADTFFPDYRKIFKKVVFEEKRENNGYKYRFLQLER